MRICSLSVPRLKDEWNQTVWSVNNLCCGIAASCEHCVRSCIPGAAVAVAVAGMGQVEDNGFFGNLRSVGRTDAVVQAADGSGCPVDLRDLLALTSFPVRNREYAGSTNGNLYRGKELQTSGYKAVDVANGK